jgi:hypothetical protein
MLLIQDGVSSSIDLLTLLILERFGKVLDMFKSSDNTPVSSRIVTNLLEYLKILLKRWLTDPQNTGSIGKLEDACLGLATNSMLKHSLQVLDTEDCCRWIIDTPLRSILQS